jgi:hypothetical protein
VQIGRGIPNFRRHLQPSLSRYPAEGSSTFPLIPLPVLSTHNVSTTATNHPTINQHTQPFPKYITFYKTWKILRATFDAPWCHQCHDPQWSGHYIHSESRPRQKLQAPSQTTIPPESPAMITTTRKCHREPKATVARWPVKWCRRSPRWRELITFDSLKARLLPAHWVMKCTVLRLLIWQK